jgi:hypothetical protein
VAVPSVTFDGTRVNASDSNTNWGNFGSGGGAPAAEAQIAYQNSLAVNTKHAGTALDGIDYDPASGAINMTTAGNKLWFAKCIVADGADVNATKGAVLYCGSANNAYDGWVVAGTGEVSNTGIFTEYPAQLGYIITAINPAITAWHDGALGVGTPSYTAVDWFGFQAAMIVGGAKGENVALDAIDVGRGLNLVGGDGVSTDAVFADFVAADQGTSTNRWGVVFSKFGIIYAQGLLVIGRNASGTVVHTDFTEPDAVVVFPDAYIDEGDFGVEFDITNASSVMSFGGTIIGRGALVSGNDTRPDLITTGTGGTLALSCKLQNFRNITLNSKTTVTGGVFNFLDMTQGTANIQGSILTTTSAANVASINDATFGTTTGIHDTEFVQGGAGHAVQITGNTQTITLTNMTWTGYGATDSSSSAIEFTGTGPHTVNVVGGNTPTIQTNTETVNVVANPVTALITVTTTAGVAIQNARVLLMASSGTGDLPYQDSVTLLGSGTVMTVTHTAHGLVTGNKVLILGCTIIEEVNGIKTITVTGVNTYTYASNTGGTPPGSITSTGVVLEGLTDVDGEISDTRSYTLAQPVTGWARKSSGSPLYKQADINGVVNTTSGFTVSVGMALDE